MKERDGYKYATKMKQFKSETERPLTAILSLNTVANTIGAACIGQQVTIIYGSTWVGLASVLVTLLILIFSEIIPKSIGSLYWKNLIGFAAIAIQVLIIIMYPIVRGVEYIAHLFPNNSDVSVSREEVVALVNAGEEEGVIEKEEKTIIRNIMRLNNISASEIMTPRVVASIASENMTLKQYYNNNKYDHFSRIPLYSDNPEYITGYVFRDDALEDLTEDRFDKKLKEIKRTLPMFNLQTPLDEIFDQLLNQKSQISVIIDQYGCFQGIITLEDIFETIFGLEIMDENDTVIDMQQYARDRWNQRQKRFKPLPHK